MVVDRDVKEAKQDHSAERMEKCAQKVFDRADILRDVRLRVATTLTFVPSGRHWASGDELQILIEPTELAPLEVLSYTANHFENYSSPSFGTSARLRAVHV